MAIQSSAMIHRPIEGIFNCVANVAFIQQLISLSSLEKNAHVPIIRQITDDPMGVGTKFVQNNEAGSHPFEITIEVTEYKRPLVFALEITRGTSISRIKWVFQPVSEGTMVALKFGPKQQIGLVSVLRNIGFITAPKSRNLPPAYAQLLREYLEERC